MARRLQKLASPTFQVPFSYTALPVAWGSTGSPAMLMVYPTVARVGDASVTEETVADAVAPRVDSAVISPAKARPFWSRLTRSDIGVEPLKNFFQLDLIVAIVADEPPDDELVAGAGVGEPAGVEVELKLGLELELLPEQAVIAAVSTRASAGARKIRRVKRWNRIGCASLGRVGVESHSLRLPRSRRIRLSAR
jgi:hypothetical protein